MIEDLSKRNLESLSLELLMTQSTYEVENLAIQKFMVEVGKLNLFPWVVSEKGHFSVKLVNELLTRREWLPLPHSII